MKHFLYLLILFVLPLSPSLAQTNTWLQVASMNAARTEQSAALLPNGSVLIRGGVGGSSSTEIYNPAANSWSTGIPLLASRVSHATTQLADGKALLVGGQPNISSTGSTDAFTFDPASNSWSAVQSMAVGRNRLTATLLANGNVLVTGGAPYGLFGGELNSAELYDPGTNTWSAAQPMGRPRSAHTATLLPNGNVLVTGGLDNSSYLSSTELYNPTTNTWSPAASMPAIRVGHRAVPLTNGKVLSGRVETRA